MIRCVPRLAAFVAVAATLMLVLGARAEAFFLFENGAPSSAGNGLVLGPDGNFWVAEEYTNSIAQITASGTVLNRYDVGADPTSVANGADGRVWVAVTGAKKLAWFDATSPTPIQHDVSIPADCGPVALTAGGDGDMYFSLPSIGGCNGGKSMIGEISDDATGTATIKDAGGGLVFDLEATGGKLFAPDFAGGVVRRIELGTLNVETQVVMPTAGAQPDGITADDAGNVWVTEAGIGQVARFPATQDGGVAAEFIPVGGTLSDPFGIVQAADGRIYVAGKGSANVMRMNTDGTGFRFYAMNDAQSQPFNIVRGSDGDVWFTDQSKTRIVRLVDDVPRIATRTAKASGPTSGSVRAAVNPRGNDTRVTFQYGKTTRYGKTTDASDVPNGADPVTVTGVLTKLASETKYHLRAVAESPEGTVTGPDQTFKTDPFPELATNTSIRVSVQDQRKVRVESISITRLRGTETATISCKGSACPFKHKRFKLPKGTKEFGPELLKSRTLPPGTVVSVLVSAPKTIGTATVLRVLRSKGAVDAPIQRACLRPGKTKPSKCP